MFEYLVSFLFICCFLTAFSVGVYGIRTYTQFKLLEKNNLRYFVFLPIIGFEYFNYELLKKYKKELANSFLVAWGILVAILFLGNAFAYAIFVPLIALYIEVLAVYAHLKLFKEYMGEYSSFIFALLYLLSELTVFISYPVLLAKMDKKEEILEEYEEFAEQNDYNCTDVEFQEVEAEEEIPFFEEDEEILEYIDDVEPELLDEKE